MKLWHSSTMTARSRFQNTLHDMRMPQTMLRLLIPLFFERLTLMNFRPLHDRVVIKLVDEETRTQGGMIIPDTAKEKPQEGEIVAVGAGARKERGEIVPLRQGRRPRAVRQMVRHRSQDRRRRAISS